MYVSKVQGCWLTNLLNHCHHIWRVTDTWRIQWIYEETWRREKERKETTTLSWCTADLEQSGFLCVPIKTQNQHCELKIGKHLENNKFLGWRSKCSKTNNHDREALLLYNVTSENIIAGGDAVAYIKTISRS